MPTVSAARGCSPTARVRRPQRVRNSRICRTTTRMIAEIAIGPWSKTALMSQPTNGMSATSGGTSSGVNCRRPAAKRRK